MGRILNRALQTIGVTETLINYDNTTNTSTFIGTSQGTGRVTCQCQGVYEILGTVAVNWGGNDDLIAVIKKNGATALATFQAPWTTMDGTWQLSVPAVQLAYGDYIELYVTSPTASRPIQYGGGTNLYGWATSLGMRMLGTEF